MTLYNLFGALALDQSVMATTPLLKQIHTDLTSTPAVYVVNQSATTISGVTNVNLVNPATPPLVQDVELLSTPIVVSYQGSPYTVMGTVGISNFPANFNVNVANQSTPPNVQNVLVTNPSTPLSTVSVTNFPSTQNVFVTSTPIVEVANFPPIQVESVVNFPGVQNVNLANPSTPAPVQPISGSVSITSTPIVSLANTQVTVQNWPIGFVTLNPATPFGVQNVNIANTSTPPGVQTVTWTATPVVYITDGSAWANLSTPADPGQVAQLIAGSRKTVTFSTTTNQNVASTDASNYENVSVQVNTVGGNAVITFQGSNDNSTWVQLALEPEGAAFQSTLGQISQTGIYYGVLPCRYFRLNVASQTSGTTSGTVLFGSIPAPSKVISGVVGLANASSVSGDAQSNGNMTVPNQIYNGTTWDRWRSVVGASDGSSVGIGAIGNYVYNGITWQRLRDATSISNTSGQGLSGVSLLGWDGTAYQRIGSTNTATPTSGSLNVAITSTPVVYAQITGQPPETVAPSQQLANDGSLQPFNFVNINLYTATPTSAPAPGAQATPIVLASSKSIRVISYAFTTRGAANTNTVAFTTTPISAVNPQGIALTGIYAGGPFYTATYGGIAAEGSLEGPLFQVGPATPLYLSSLGSDVGGHLTYVYV